MYEFYSVRFAFRPSPSELLSEKPVDTNDQFMYQIQFGHLNARLLLQLEHFHWICHLLATVCNCLDTNPLSHIVGRPEISWEDGQLEGDRICSSKILLLLESKRVKKSIVKGRCMKKSYD